MNLLDLMVAKMNEPIKTKPVFSVGQSVRVMKFAYDDGQTPGYWSGARGVVVKATARGLLNKRWFYQIRHENGRNCEFDEDELDMRFTRKGRHG